MHRLSVTTKGERHANKKVRLGQASRARSRRLTKRVVVQYTSSESRFRRMHIIGRLYLWRRGVLADLILLLYLGCGRGRLVFFMVFILYVFLLLCRVKSHPYIACYHAASETCRGLE
ncbi:uncharacterized protein BKA55DRAFT_335500 [Fusarium redolens]|uniref:Transmembrane protein n=1 Tax=Fusarium redolens TaxID=48865 RepID=A0A9P9HE73_FUSRE|nr:uncharacterized protein BKA55DRAFT_335500 [Fusarium redolens]KAH7255903.1 hypothetical protein BKA55DRAFT_335500 [Fusarium redolens]